MKANILTLLSPGSEYFIIVLYMGAYFHVFSLYGSCTSEVVKQISPFPVPQWLLELIAELQTREVKC